MVSVDLGELVQIQSSVLDEKRECLIMLPESYYGSNSRYPVLYILDANFSPYYEKDLFTVQCMRLIQLVPELIIVGIYNTIRDRDRIPVTVPEKEESGGSEKFLAFITEELRPMINTVYRTTDYNLIYGASNAGLFTLYALLQRPDVFNGVISSSPMIGWCEKYIYEQAEESFKTHRYSNKLYMIYGKDDYPQITDTVPDFTEYLKENAPKDLRWELKYLPEEGHVPYTSLYDGLRFLFPRKI
ncbi:alpha/beta hydrolase-fold protein [Candidatus Bathyarchaeota archaeon]|nr:alpha/beta hydrolase-fold protein [Candidatus Bathyarchaeota archaeon]